QIAEAEIGSAAGAEAGIERAAGVQPGDGEVDAFTRALGTFPDDDDAAQRVERHVGGAVIVAAQEVPEGEGFPAAVTEACIEKPVGVEPADGEVAAEEV